MAKHINNYFVRDKGKPTEKYFARVCYTDSLGKRRQLTKRVDKKSKIPEAVAWLEKEAKRLSKAVTDPELDNRCSLNQFLDYWLSVIRPDLRERTYDDYESLLRRYVRPSLGKRPVSNLEPKHIQGVIVSMRDKKLAPRTVRYMHTVLSSALKFAVYPCRLLEFNPADARANYVTLPTQEQRDYVWLSDEHREKFLETVENDPNGLILEFALLSGLRPEEFLALRWNDIELERALVTVERVVFRRTKRQTQEGKPPFWFEKPKTKKSRRTITLPYYLTRKLAHRETQLKEKYLARGESWEKDTLVFPSEAETPFKPWNLHRRIFKPLLQKAGLPDMEVIK